MASTAKKQKVDKDESVDEVESESLEKIDSIQNEVSEIQCPVHIHTKRSQATTTMKRKNGS